MDQPANQPSLAQTVVKLDVVKMTKIGSVACGLTQPARGD